MRNFLIAALLTVASASAHAELSVLDTAEWGGSSYFLLDKSSWFDAQAQAEIMGGNLITINSAVNGNKGQVTRSGRIRVQMDPESKWVQGFLSVVDFIAG